MGRFFRDRLDRLAGLASESEYENAVYRERFIALRRQLPWLYATLCINVVSIFFPMGVVTAT
jgi:hypothetical protein